MPLKDTIGYQMKSSDPGVSYFFWSCWPVRSHRSLQTLPALGYPELDGRASIAEDTTDLSQRSCRNQA